MVVIDGDPEQCDNIFVINNRQAVMIAIRHLVDLGHRDIAYIAGPQELYAARARKDAFFEAMNLLGLEVHLEWLQSGAFHFHSGVEGVKRILRNEKRPTAIFCANDDTAFGALDALQQAGLRVPEDMSVVGFDDVQLAPHSHPPLTTVRHPVDEIARAATIALLDNIDRGTPILSRTFPGELILRKSTAPPSTSAGVRRYE